MVLCLHETQRLCEVGVVGDNECAVVSVVPCVVQDVKRKVHVGTLFLVLPDGDAGRGRIGVLHGNAVAQEMPVVEFQARAMGVERAQVGLLPHAGVRIARRRLDARGEVLDLDEIVPCPEDSLEQGHRIQPLPRRSADGSVIEVESIDVDDSAVGWIGRADHLPRPKKQGPPEGGPAPDSRSHRGSRPLK